LWISFQKQLWQYNVHNMQFRRSLNVNHMVFKL
jgi:hypothetical protein